MKVIVGRRSYPRQMNGKCFICQATTYEIDMCDSCAIEYQNARSNYNHPPISLQLMDDSVVEFLHNTTRELDDYHRSLLSSRDPKQVALGIMSSVFWTFCSRSLNYAHSRTRWLLYGRVKKEGLRGFGIPKSADVVQRSIQMVKRNDVASAIKTVSMLPELRHPALSSNLLSLIAPDNCGVYDKRVHSVLNLMKPNSGGVTNPKADKYAKFCKNLQKVAQLLNQGIESGRSWGWVEKDVEHTYRAVDVARALSMKKSPLK